MSLGFREFGRADIEVSIDLNGIAVDDFPAKREGQVNRQARLATACRSGNNDQRSIHRGRSK